MDNVKRFISVFSVVLLVLCSICFTADAGSFSACKAELAEYLEKEFHDFNTKIDLSDFKIPRSEVSEIYTLVKNEIPTAFNVDEYSVYSQYDICKYIKVTYRYSEPEYYSLLDTFRQNTEYILRDLRGSRLSEEEKVLLVHDRLVAFCGYDYVNYYNDSIPEESYTAFGAIVKRTAVCAGYTRAFIYLLGKLGIKCEYINSKELNHAWNIVTVNGRKYHVDTTWDGTSICGRVGHDNLLRSTEGIMSTEHNATDFDSSPRDTAYDEYYWQKSNTEFQLFNGSLYYIELDTGNVVKRTGGTEEVIYTVEDKWPTGNLYYPKCYSKLGCDGKYLYYTTPTSVYSIDSGNNIQLMLEPDLPDGYYIYGFSVYDRDMHLYCFSSPNVTYETDMYTLTYRYSDDCKITYNANGGDNAPMPEYVAGNVDAYISGVRPVRTGSSFLGWSTDPHDTEEEFTPGQAINVKNDTVLYAVYSQDTDSYEDTNAGNNVETVSEPDRSGSSDTVTTGSPDTLNSVIMLLYKIITWLLALA